MYDSGKIPPASGWAIVRACAAWFVVGPRLDVSVWSRQRLIVRSNCRTTLHTNCCLQPILFREKKCMPRGTVYACREALVLSICSGRGLLVSPRTGLRRANQHHHTTHTPTPYKANVILPCQDNSSASFPPLPRCGVLPILLRENTRTHTHTHFRPRWPYLCTAVPDEVRAILHQDPTKRSPYNQAARESMKERTTRLDSDSPRRET